VMDFKFCLGAGVGPACRVLYHHQACILPASLEADSSRFHFRELEVKNIFTIAGLRRADAFTMLADRRFVFAATCSKQDARQRHQVCRSDTPMSPR
jgi:hypothetical protein